MVGACVVVLGFCSEPRVSSVGLGVFSGRGCVKKERQNTASRKRLTQRPNSAPSEGCLIALPDAPIFDVACAHQSTWTDCRTPTQSHSSAAIAEEASNKIIFG